MCLSAGERPGPVRNGVLQHTKLSLIELALLSEEVHQSSVQCGPVAGRMAAIVCQPRARRVYTFVACICRCRALATVLVAVDPVYLGEVVPDDTLGRNMATVERLSEDHIVADLGSRERSNIAVSVGRKNDVLLVA